ncbi:MAG: serine hydrolase domain-containing protein [Fimbriimonadales bacterium]
MRKWALVVACLVSASAIADELDDFIHSERVAKKIPGLAVAIIKEGVVSRVVTSGVANLDLEVPVKRETVFEIGSMTKAFTAELIMMLEEAGKLTVEDKISKYVDSCPESWKDITIRHLLTHTSGISNYTSLKPELILSGKRITYNEMFDLVKVLPLDFPVGEKYQYSNTGYYLLGHIIEKVAEKSFVDYLTEKILLPLEMTKTFPQRARGVVKNRATGYMVFAVSPMLMPFIDADGAFSAGNLVSTVDDMAKWDEALLEGKLLKPETRDKMYQITRIKDGISTYAFGWDVSEVAGHKARQHGGGTGGFSTYILRLPDDKLSVVVLSNLAQTDVASIARGAARIELPELAEKAIRDPDAEITKKHKTIIEKIIDGTIQRTPFEEKTADELFPTLIAQARQQLIAFGKFEKFELLEHKHEPKMLTRRYRMTFEKVRVQLVIREDGDDKIIAIFLRPD